MTSKLQIFSVISFLTFTIIVGVLIFARGFLLNRKIITEKSGSCNFTPDVCDLGSIGECQGLEDDIYTYVDWCQKDGKPPKLVVLLVDALKFSFVKRLQFLSSLVDKRDWDDEQKSSHYSCLFKFVADPPTTTMQRLKALTTGTMPTFIDASANFNSYEVEEDSLIFQLFSNGKRIAFLGDDTWLSLYAAKHFRSSFVQAHPSFNAWDLDTVDSAVNASLRNVFATNAVKDWEVLISHILGVDHCGHRYGPNHPEMTRKLQETDDMIKFIYESMDENTLLTIFGDHGMTETGDHGGDSREETDSALIFISKSNNKIQLRCPSKLAAFEEVQEVSQVDLVPTLSVILGVPIPYSNIGQILSTVLPQKMINEALAANIAQIHRYVADYSGVKLKPERNDVTSTSSFSFLSHIQSSYRIVLQSFQEYRTKYRSAGAVEMTKSASGSSKEAVRTQDSYQALAEAYFQNVKSLAKTTWTEFDTPVMYMGVAISSLSVLCMCIFLYFITSRRSDSNFVSTWTCICPFFPHVWVFISGIFPFGVYIWFRGIVVSALGGLILFLVSLLFTIVKASRYEIISTKSHKDNFTGQFSTTKHLSQSQSSGIETVNNFGNNNRKVGSNLQLKPNISNRKSVAITSLDSTSFLGFESSEAITILLYSATCFGVFSNSFVINEGYILGNVLLAMVAIHLMCSRRSLEALGVNVEGDAENNRYIVGLPSVRKHFKCSWISFMFLALILRVSHNFFRCREELPDCRDDFLLHKQLASLPADWIVHKFIRYGVELLSLAIFVVAFRHWLMYRQISASSRPSALVARYIPTILVVLNCTCRALQGLPFPHTGYSHLQSFFEYLPRIFVIVALGAILLIWLKPLCCVGRPKSCFMSSFDVNNLKRSRQAVNGESDQNPNIEGTHSNSILKDTVTTIPQVPSATNMSKKIVWGNSEIHRNFHTCNSSGRGVGLVGKLENRYVGDGAVSTFSSMHDENLSDDVFSSSILSVGILVTLILVQITSEGMSPSLAMCVYAAVCLVGIYRNNPNQCLKSWSTAATWCMASQYFFYATGHQPVFSAIPWDSAFIGAASASTNNTSALSSSPDSFISWVTPALAVLGNLYASTILFSLLVPLLAYWKADKDKPESFMGDVERRHAFILFGKILVLHGMKLILCMFCAAWQRRHLMVWKIFAPKLIFEVISFMITVGSITFAMLLLIRIDFRFQKYRRQQERRAHPSECI